jgi:hypothetical protein
MFQLLSIASLALSAVVAVNGAALPHRDVIAARHAAIARDETSYDTAVLEVNAYLSPLPSYLTRHFLALQRLHLPLLGYRLPQQAPDPVL